MLTRRNTTRSSIHSADFESGELLLIDKPIGWTSFDVVNKIRYAVKAKVGHAGTLDPLATGLLIIATGRATKQLEEFIGLGKEYTGTMTLGQTTPSFDGETEVDHEYDTSHITLEMINKTAWSFIGEIVQEPPVFSAVKREGKKSYILARKGKPQVPAPRQVSIHSFEITAVNMPEVHFKVSCSKGTYIRSLVHDFGKALHNGAWLSRLCRTRIGEYRLEDAWPLDEFIDLVKSLKDT